jgi:alpha-D-ribose 1-methylphosphonate 5-triphosphate synthase subunit PhnH
MTAELHANLGWDPLQQQRGFRRLLDAFARPGEVVKLAPPARMPAWLFALAILCDREVTLADPGSALSPSERRFLQAREATPGEAQFVLLDGRAAVPAGFAPRLGTLECPEHGATLVMTCAAVGRGPERLALSGPGIPGARDLALDGLDPSWIAERARWVDRFPQGVDLLLADGERVAALPRTTRVALEVR